MANFSTYDCGSMVELAIELISFAVSKERLSHPCDAIHESPRLPKKEKHTMVENGTITVIIKLTQVSEEELLLQFAFDICKVTNVYDLMSTIVFSVKQVACC